MVAGGSIKHMLKRSPGLLAVGHSLPPRKTLPEPPKGIKQRPSGLGEHSERGRMIGLKPIAATCTFHPAASRKKVARSAVTPVTAMNWSKEACREAIAASSALAL